MGEIIKADRKPRAKRRNYEKELASLQTWAEVSINVMEGILPSLTPSGNEELFMKGQVAAVRAVLAKIEGGKA